MPSITEHGMMSGSVPLGYLQGINDLQLRFNSAPKGRLLIKNEVTGVEVDVNLSQYAPGTVCYRRATDDPTATDSDTYSFTCSGKVDGLRVRGADDLADIRFDGNGHCEISGVPVASGS